MFMGNRSSNPAFCHVITLHMTRAVFMIFFGKKKKSINRFQTIQLFSNLLYSVIKLNSFCKTIDFWSLVQNCLVHRLKYPQNIANHLFILFSKFVSSLSYLQHRCILRVIHSLITKTIQVFLLNSLFQKSCYWHSHILP